MFGRNKEGSKLSALEEARKAYENLSEDDKKSFHKSIADRVHESIAAQERERGQEDRQSAEAREHEALESEHADGKGEVSEPLESDDTAEEKNEDAAEEVGEDAEGEARDEVRQEAHKEVSEASWEDSMKELREEIAKLSARLDLVERTPQKADETTADKLDRIANRYEN